jgi:hypothetical protein
MKTRLGWIAGAAVVTLLAGSMSASAVSPLGPAVAVLTGCSGVGGDAAITADGTTRGFAECSGHPYGPIAYFRHKPGQAPFGDTTPYTGIVRAVAWDGVDSTYVVFEQNSQLKIGKRVEHTGNYVPTTTLSTTGAGVVFYTADVVAASNKWYAVWSEQVGIGEFAHTQLFQRHTLFGVQGRTRLTVTAENVSDSQPSLAKGTSAVIMAWRRATDPEVPGHSQVRLARNFGSGWGPFIVADAGKLNSQPDVAAYAGHTYLTWIRDGAVRVADDSQGNVFVGHQFSGSGTHPRVAVSGANVFVAWTADDPANRVVLAQRTNGSWTGAQIAGPPSTLVTVVAQATKARVVYRTGSVVAVRPQI